MADHPLLAFGSPEDLKEEGHFKDDKWYKHDHLSPYDYGFRSRRNFSVLAGYTKNGDGAQAWGTWEWKGEHLPRDKVLWHPQYAKKEEQRAALGALEKKSTGDKIADDVNLVDMCGTTILQVPLDDTDVGHWRLKGGAITLAQLFLTFGPRFTAQELFFWYYNAEKVVKKRAHSWGSREVRDAAKMRQQVFGHYGHRR